MTHRLMIPGPVPLGPESAAALTEPVQAHYGPAWVAVHNETLDLLRQVFGTRGDVFALVGSGSAGLDAAIGSLLAPGQTAVVGVNGYFGQRLATIARLYGADVVEATAEWGRALDPDAFAHALSAHPEASAVIVTQVETSTGVVNPIRPIARLANAAGVPIMVDAVSSLGGLEMEMDAWGIDLCVSASQKALGGPAGLAPVAVGPRAWAAIEQRGSTGRGWYLNLLVWREYAQTQQHWHPFPVTIPTSAFLALRAGLRALLSEGLPQRFERFARLAARLRQGLAALGYLPLAVEAEAAPVVTAAHSLPGVPSGRVVEFLDRVHQIKIAGGGLGPLHDTVFRVGHMAPTVADTDIDCVLVALEAFKQQLPA
jgi:alanine-glyoxylate transaminase/serine-glyoxylate transaminase/serine-pyruvate transaminase